MSNTFSFLGRMGRAVSGVLVAGALAMFACAVTAHAQFGAPPSTHVQDTSALKPPPGARIAIVEFDDLECPACAHANPTLKQAAAQYKIPWIRHDFLIPGHIWSPKAAVYARWFDTKSKALGDEYRDEVFANQTSIYNQDVLQQFTNKFAQAHGVALPFALDPDGKLNGLVQADSQLGRRTGVVQTPTVFIVTATNYYEVHNVDQDLYRTIDQATAQLKH
jgi:protein-disulfide isomerase